MDSFFDRQLVLIVGARFGGKPTSITKLLEATESSPHFLPGSCRVVYAKLGHRSRVHSSEDLIRQIECLCQPLLPRHRPGTVQLVTSNFQLQLFQFSLCRTRWRC